jgi:hypothetical protein
LLYFFFQNVVSEDIELIADPPEDCEDGEHKCINVVLNITKQLVFISKPVHSLLLEVEVRNKYYCTKRCSRYPVTDIFQPYVAVSLKIFSEVVNIIIKEDI